MSNAAAKPPSTKVTRAVVDTDVASYIFKWHAVLAPRYLEVLQGAEWILSFMTVAEMRQGALNAGWGERRRKLLESYLRDFAVLHSDDRLCALWAGVRDESVKKGRPISAADAWIAATAIALAAPLATNNPKDFQHLNGIELLTVQIL